jgi:hypothetical protein
MKIPAADAASDSFAALRCHRSQPAGAPVRHVERAPDGDTISSSVNVDLFGGLQYTRFLREDLAMTFGVQSVGAEAGSSIGPQGVFAGTVGVFTVPVGLRWNPLARGGSDQALKPFVAATVGPVFGSSAGSFVGGGGIMTGNVNQATAGGHIGGGIDVHVTRSFSVGISDGYN